MKQQNFSIKKRIRSFGYALNGLKILVREEHNARIHLFATICVVVAGIALKISETEWIAVVFAIGLVIALEAINSSIENIADFVSPEKHNWIKKIKDLSAAGVLIGSIAAAVVGFIIFIPKILSLFC
jgi:diacylglycerol kinase (ATP)